MKLFSIILIGWSVGMLASCLLIYIFDPQTLKPAIIIASCPAVGMYVSGIILTR